MYIGSSMLRGVRGSKQRIHSLPLSTHAALCTAKSILSSIVSDKSSGKGWLEQRLVEEQEASKGGRRFPAGQRGRPLQRTQGAVGSSTSTGFTKIERSKRLAERQGSSSAKGPSEDAGSEAELTLTAKDLAAKVKWQQSDTAKSRLQDRLRDTSLEAWQRRKIELKLKHGSEKWEPTKKIATSSMEKIRLLNSEFPEVWTMKRLSEQFKVSQETVRRILKSGFRPSEQRLERREQRRKSEMQAYKDRDKAQLRNGATSSGGASG
ncbi:Required for respiratory growth protein 9 mitochondrial [Coemansia sp. BCRC 34301]|nr:Required for respiratory growth protein 9 mitochondrial [Coemansia sp. BCRC 34301]